MDTKNKLLYLLEKNKGSVISGEKAAGELLVSRAAVWKAAQALREEGVEIVSEAGSGYSLHTVNDVLLEGALRAYLPQEEISLQVLKETPSTNGVAKAWAIEGAPHGSMVVAEKQTAGRGRLGRGFESPPGGIYMSIILRPQAGWSESVLITAAAAVAVCRQVEKLCNIQLGIKWVNDLFFGSKKCCGILTEAGTNFENGAIDYIVVGIGLNYTTPADFFTKEGDGVAASLYPSGNAPVGRTELIGNIYKELISLFEVLGKKDFLQEYSRRSIVLGKEVTVMANPPYTAKALAINEEANLLVETTQGEQKWLSSGEISIRLC